MIEKNKIYCMDCLEGMKQMEAGSVDLVVTDPPYLIQHIHEYTGSRLGRDIMSYQKPLHDNNLTEGYDIRILDEICRLMKKPNIYVWCNIAQVPMYIKYFVLERGCRMDILIWHKTNPMPLCSNKWLSDKEYCLYFRKGAYCQPSGYAEAKTVWNLPSNVKDKKAFGHPTIKPLPIIENIIRNSSREGELVLDPFMGSGTT
ncbi:MAG: site-specific DNA-methyltransferase, partial [Ruminococcus flavefaciens]|nr:site-specific DNA-methyltransferase [Ruminococcus flavefaciens]